MNVVKIINKSKNPTPQYETTGSAGMDIRAVLEQEVGRTLVILPGDTAIISTGVFLEIPEDMECQVRSRSSLAAATGLSVLNSPGTIDSDYRGEIKIILHNHSKNGCTIHYGDRIAQLVFAKVERPRLFVVEELSSTDRGEGGLGSTGTK